MKLKSHNYRNTLYFVLFLAVVAAVSGIRIFREPLEQTKTMKLGGLRSTAHNSGEIESMGRFAVEQHNKNKNTFLKFGRIVSAQEQVVAGKLYHLKLEAVDGGKNKIYEAKVWVKPWMNFKQLQEFKEVGANPITSSDHGTKHGD